jgi:hypothetical protein
MDNDICMQYSYGNTGGLGVAFRIWLSAKGR